LIERLPHELSLRRACELLGLNRSTFYYQKEEASIDDIDLLNAIRDIWERYPFYGYRRITQELRGAENIIVNRKRVQRLMAEGDIQAIFPGPNTSKRNKRDAVHPYLLKGLDISYPNQVWMVDITYLRMQNGFMYLFALIDVYSRYVVGWSLSNTLDTEFCLSALKAGCSYEMPEIVNSDQGCQFTSMEWINFLREWNIKISMTGKGRCADNIYIERFWRSFKREEFYLNEYQSVQELRTAIGTYIEFYNQKRWHQALNYKRPADVYFEQERKNCGFID
jgi:putative transposase